MAQKKMFPYTLGISLILSILIPVIAAAFNFNMGAMVRGVSDSVGLYGNGADGALTVNGVPNGPANPLQINTTTTYSTADAGSGATSITVASIAGFASGQEILIIQMTGTDAGKYAFATLSAAAGSTLTFSPALTTTFASANKIQVLRVMKYTNVTINSGGFLTVPSYATATGTGGVLVMKVSGTLTINNGGAGLSGHVSVGGGYNSFVPRGFAGGTSANGDGPVGGASASNAGGGSNSPGSHARLIMGSGGGSAASTGGRGGGVILVNASSVVLNGGIRADGQTSTVGNAGGGGGGAILLQTDSLTTTATCGAISSTKGNGVGTGTAGADGRIFIHYTTTLSCTTATPASTSTYEKYYLK